MIGQDTRLSGDMLAAALTAGILATGSDALLLGTIPTPAVALLIREYQADCGVVISASHNPFADNGLKLFGADGYKVSDELEQRIEELILRYDHRFPYAQDKEIGRTYRVEEARSRYLNFLRGCLGKNADLRSLKIVIDCANGAAGEVASDLWRSLGVSLVVLHDAPNGVNINEQCGSTDLRSLQEAVRFHQADIGFAYDGDADRCLAVDADGQAVDGDQILAVCALDMQRTGRLIPHQVVGTVMSNIGLNLRLNQAGIVVQNSAVGDRCVLQTMKKTGAILGGEPSGHIIFHQHSTTGDGLLTSLKLAEIVCRTAQPLAQLAAQMSLAPQVLLNVPVLSGGQSILHELAYQEQLAAWTQRLAGEGKILVRASGTEPLIRILVQGPNLGAVKQLAEEIKDYITCHTTRGEP
jgi:phosphoglucosamine mutase